MLIFLAAAPLLLVLFFMIGLRWSGQKAGLVSWGASVLIAWLTFGLTPEVFQVSQIKGLQLSIFVLAVMWPAIFLFHLVDSVGGIKAIPLVLQKLVPDPAFLQLLLAWAFSGMLEGLAGFGLPVAIVAPMLVELGSPPLLAVAAVAVGHAWAVTFGDMGVIFQTLLAVVNLPAEMIIPPASLMLGIACLACGFSVAWLLRLRRRLVKVALIGLIMGIVQWGLARTGLASLASFGAGLTGLAAAVLSSVFSRILKMNREKNSTLLNQNQTGSESEFSEAAIREEDAHCHPIISFPDPSISHVLFSYGILSLLMVVVFVIPEIRESLAQFSWQSQFPAVQTAFGFKTMPARGPAFRLFLHPGFLIGLAISLTILRLHLMETSTRKSYVEIAGRTWRSSVPASLGILAMVGLSTLMDHCGMTHLLAQGICGGVGKAFPLFSSWVGILGAFATGSNNNSNVLFGPLQKGIAEMLGVSAPLLVAAQTAGGSLGSLLAPAKLIVGCSTVGAIGQEGMVLRKTFMIGLVIGLLLGILCLAGTTLNWG